MLKGLKILTIAADFLENIWNFGLTINETIWKLYLEHMILLRKVVYPDNIYINESHWPYTLQIHTVCKFWVEISHGLMKIFFILKGWSDNLAQFVFFFIKLSNKEIVNSWFFLTFNLIMSHILPENFIKISQVVQKIWRFSLTIYFFLDNQFFSFFWLFDNSLLQRNWWRQLITDYFFTFNIL